MLDQHPHITAWVTNLVGAAAIVSSALGWAPAFGALVAAIWYMIKIYESATVQRWVQNRRVRRLARLKAQVLMLEAQSRAPLPLPSDENRNS